MSEEFDSPLERNVRKEARDRTTYADSQIEPGLKILMSEVRNLFNERVLSSEAEISDKDVDRIFAECVGKVPGSEEAFEIWDKLYDDYQPE